MGSTKAELGLVFTGVVFFKLKMIAAILLAEWNTFPHFTPYLCNDYAISTCGGIVSYSSRKFCLAATEQRHYRPETGKIRGR
jgi:hypothetical protein